MLHISTQVEVTCRHIFALSAAQNWKAFASRITNGDCQSTNTDKSPGLLCSNDTTLAFLQSDEQCPLGFFVALSEVARSGPPCGSMGKRSILSRVCAWKLGKQ